MDKQLRQQIKHDRFVEEVRHGVEYLQEHGTDFRKYGTIVAVVLIVVLGGFGFLRWQKNSRQQDLRKATLVQDAYVGEQVPAGALSFKTQAEKDAAALKAFNEVAAKHGASKEGQLARFHAATLLCDQGKAAECEAALKQAAAGPDAEVASLAKLSLATLYQSQGKANEAEAISRDLVSKPTVLVSKEQAQITLARAIMRTKPQEARSICESLQALDRPAVTRACVGLLGELLNPPAN